MNDVALDEPAYQLTITRPGQPTEHRTVTGAGDTQSMVLRQTLQLAVPMHLIELQNLPANTLTRIASEAATVVGSHGDALQFGGKHCKEAFNALARGLAAAALCTWGGIDFDGLHWCSVQGCRSRGADHPQPWPWTPRTMPPPRQVEDVSVADAVL